MNAISKATRSSNLELLRIISMLLVLIVHADFLSISEPKVSDIIESPGISFMRFFVEAIAIVCVNSFVLISGWFGINPRLKRFCAFSFQVIFFSVILYFLNNNYNRSLGEWLTIILGFQYWFVKAYIILYILSPILNTYAESVTKKQFLIFILIFYLVQTIYGWYLGNANWFDKGYSPLSFIGLYLVARYLKLYHPFSFKTTRWLSLYLLCVLFISLWGYYGVKYNYDAVPIAYAYNSPPVIIASICFFMAFTKLKIKTNKVINSIAISSFAVYLFHYHECILHHFYTDIIKNCFLTQSTFQFTINTSFWILFIFFISILLDKIRLLVWSLLIRLITTNKCMK